MQYTILLLTFLLAFTQALDIDFGLSTDIDLSAQIGAALSGDLNIGTGLAAILNSVATISSDLTVSGTLTLGNSFVSPLLRIAANTSVYVDSFAMTNGEIEMGEGSVLYISGAASFSADATLSSSLIVGGTVTIDSGAAIYVSGTASLEAVDVAADATLEFSADAVGILSGSISLAAGAVIEASGTVSISGDVSGSGTIIFSADSQLASFLESENIEGSVVVSGSSLVSFRSSTTTTISSDLSIEGSGYIVIDSDTSVTVQGSASFESDSSYQISVSSADSEDVLTVEGEASLDGTLVVDSDIEITADVDIVVMFYGSRAEGSTFSSVSVSSAKRALSASEYEVDYQDTQAVVRASSNTDSSVVLSLGSAALLLALF